VNEIAHARNQARLREATRSGDQYQEQFGDHRKILSLPAVVRTKKQNRPSRITAGKPVLERIA
jgi:hypothetical protein